MQPAYLPPRLRSLCFIAAAAFLGAAAFLCAGEPPADATVHTEKVATTPHFYQGDPRGGFPNDGRDYCCPTAISDSFVYLAAHGFPRLLPDGKPVDAQIAMITKLAGHDFLGTDPVKGTDSAQACVGIQRYVESCGYACKSLEYNGWRPMPRALAGHGVGTLATLDWIKPVAARADGAVWLNIGWYVHGPAENEWTRVGGHWVALIGFGTDGKGHDDPTLLLVDNPAIRAAKDSPEISANVMTTEIESRGRLTGNYQGLPREAAGMLRVGGPGVQMSKRYDAAFLDGAVMLIIDARSPAH